MTITPKTFDRVIEGGLFFIIFFTPLAFGSTQVWAYTLMELAVISLIAIWFIKWTLKKETAKCNKSKVHPVLLIPISLFICLILFQMLPLPSQFIKHLSPNTYKLYEQSLPNWPALKDARPESQDSGFNHNSQLTTHNWRSISIHRHATSIELIKILAYIGIFFLIITSIKTRHQIKRVVITIIITGFVLSLFGIVQYFTWNGKLYWFNELTYGGSPFGPYVNKNHFAGYMIMVIPLTIGFLISSFQISNFQVKRWRYYISELEAQISKNMLLLFAIIIMITALFLSQSRGGILSFLLSMVFLASLSLFFRRSKRKGGVFFLITIFTLSALFLFWLGIDPIIDRLLTLKNPDKIGHERLAVYRDTSNIIKDFPLFGTGLGTFEDIYPGYETTKSRYIFDQTHNDYLGLLSDTGFLGGLFILGEILAVLIVIVRRWTKRRNTFTTGITGHVISQHSGL
jgi:O-antigen ligase